jgi:hydrogenase-4 component H
VDILNVIFAILRRGPSTYHLPRRPATSARSRSPLSHDVSACTGCTACAYVCSPAAIKVTEVGDGAVWEFDPGRCTICARCVEVCQPQALKINDKLGTSYTEVGGLRQMSEVKYPTCQDCGKKIRPLSKKVLQKVPEELRNAVEEGSQLCEECRRRRYQRRMASPAGILQDEKDER